MDFAARWTGGPTNRVWSSTSSSRGDRWENDYVESFNGRFRDQCLNENWFLDLADAREKIAACVANSCGVR